MLRKTKVAVFLRALGDTCLTYYIQTEKSLNHYNLDSEIGWEGKMLN